MSALLLLAGMLGDISAQSVWTVRNSGTTNLLHSVIWTDNLLVTVGEGGTILTSANGVNWVSQVSGITNPLNSVAWTGKQFVAVGGADFLPLKRAVTDAPNYFGGALASQDAVHWTSANSTGTLRSICSKSVAVGENGIMTSPDSGTRWQSKFFAAIYNYRLYSVIWTGTQFMTLGWYGAANDTILSAGILTSSDAVTWISKNPGITRVTLYSAAWTGSQLVAVGSWDSATSTKGVILTSADGNAWTPRAAGVANSLYSVTWTGKQLVATGSGGVILTSPNGINWTARNSGTTNGIVSVIWTGTQFVAVGDGGTILTSPQEPVSIAPNFSAQDYLPFRLESNQLFATIPASFSGSTIRASIFTVNGNKVQEVNAGNSATGLALPLGDLTNGIYLFEMQSEDIRMTRTFSLMR